MGKMRRWQRMGKRGKRPAAKPTAKARGKAQPAKKRRMVKKKVRARVVVKSPSKLKLFYRYLYRRMLVNVKMHGTATVLRRPAPKPPHDPVLDLCTMGNAYRHLDTGDGVEGAVYRRLVGARLDRRPDDEQLAQLLQLCVLRMAGFNVQRRQEWAREARRAEDVAALEALPWNKDEALDFARWLEKREPEHRRPTNPTLWQDAGFQTQGFRWIAAIRAWFQKDKLADVVRSLRAARTWKEANLVVNQLPGVGRYTGAQAMCTLLSGVCKGNASLIFTSEYDTASMRDWCGYGPGPVSSCRKIFGKGVSPLSGIRWLRNHADEQFTALGIRFPYLPNRDGSRRELSCVDIEHSLCYFSRYMRARETLGGRAEELHRLIGGKAKRWSIKELSGLSADGAFEEAQRRLDEGGAPPGKKQRGS